MVAPERSRLGRSTPPDPSDNVREISDPNYLSYTNLS